MIRARIGPLLGLFALLGAALVVRLFEVQVLEHEVWAREAAGLVRKGLEQPYRRGRILDATGRVLAADEELRTVDLVYRDFRREHPLGQVAHARSLLEGRPIPLGEARTNLLPWARELVALGPEDLRALARGTDARLSPRALEPRQGTRRAADVLFYLPRLLGFDPQERAPWRRLMELVLRPGEKRSFLALAALVRHGDAPDGMALEERAMDERLTHALQRLGVLASWIRPAGDPTADPLSALVDELEGVRRSVEDAVAAKLFSEAVGFVPGRVENDTLLSCFDHGWIAALLCWDGERLAEWARAVRGGWQASWRDGECLPQLFLGLAADPGASPGPADFLARLAVVYRPEGALEEALGSEGPLPWRRADELAVFAGMEEMFAAQVPEAALALGREALPFQLAELRADPDEERLLPPGDGPDSFRGSLARCLGGKRIDTEGLLALAQTLDEIWELRFQETLRSSLDLTRHAAARGELGPEGGLILSLAGRERAGERAEYFLKDFGSRPRTLSKGELSYDVVYLLTRFDRDFPGFRVRKLETRARIELDPDDLRPADRLIGFVTAPTLDDLVRQRRERARLADLKADPDREEREADELRRLIGAVLLPSELRGAAGIEAFFDRELTGRNGYAQTRGLADVFGSEELPVCESVDGADVVLTLDAALQRAAQRCLRQPAREHEDEAWRAHPVGAVVLLDAEGDVLAAASEPDDQSLLDPLASGQRQVRSERTLKKPTFQPPGSVFKPFVAAWALEHGLDPTRTVVCGPTARGAGYKDLLCSSVSGHGAMDLHAALAQSCNAYFAWLGETLTTSDFAALATAFGFGQPTGVRRLPPWDDGTKRRFGLSEDVAALSLPKAGREWPESLLRRAANGLSVVEATPMQLARATLALARGELRELRVVARVGEHELPRGALTPLPIGRSALDFVHRALVGVAQEAHGTAHNALGREQLGFDVAVKTGSADLESPKDDAGRSKVRKHAWVAGWAPAEEPTLVFVVFEHDTSATSSHGAVYLARDLLRQPEVRAWLEARGVRVAEVAER